MLRYPLDRLCPSHAIRCLITELPRSASINPASARFTASISDKLSILFLRANRSNHFVLKTRNYLIPDITNYLIQYIAPSAIKQEVIMNLSVKIII